MSKLGILGATALSLALAVATPALAAGRGGGGGGMHVGGGGGGGMHFAGGGGGGGGGMPMGGAAGFRGAQASIGPRAAPINGGNFAGRGSAQFAQGGFRDHGHRGFGRGAGFVAGLAAGGALGYGYDPYYYGDDYAYDDTYDDGYAAYPAYAAPAPGYVVSSVADPTYCAQRYRSWDPASRTYLGFDGLRHPCGQ
jgi:hypothetical protein